MIRPCIRLCALAALRHGPTLAGMRWFDSDNSPLLEVMKEEKDSPYGVVYTDDDVRTDVMGMDIGASVRTLGLILEVGVASKIMIRPEDEEEEIPALELPATDEAMELGLDLMEYQAIRALWQDPYNPWGALLRSMVLSIRRAPSIRGAQAGQGGRFAMRQITFQLGNVISDPFPGVLLDGTSPIKQFIDAAKVNTTLSIKTAAIYLETFIETVANPEWRQLQAMLGLTEQGIRGSGAGPLSMTAPDQEAALLDTEDGSIEPKEEVIP